MHEGDMDQEVHLKDIGDVLSQLDYPTDRSTAIDELGETTVRLADGRINLGEVIERTGSEQYNRSGDLRAAIHAALPRRAVGEPYQSEGDA